MAVRTEVRMTNIFDQAVQAYGDALKAGVKIQEEIARWWNDALDQAGPMQEWQKRSRAMFSEAIPAAQKNSEEWLRLIEQNYRNAIELLKKTFSSEETDTSELQAKIQELWERSLAVVRESTQAMAQANAKMMELWADMLRRNDGTEASSRASVAVA